VAFAVLRHQLRSRRIDRRLRPAAQVHYREETMHVHQTES
jgi:hypothetical protein